MSAAREPDACACVDPIGEALALAYLKRVLEIELLAVEEAVASFAGERTREPLLATDGRRCDGDSSARCDDD